MKCSGKTSFFIRKANGGEKSERNINIQKIGTGVNIFLIFDSILYLNWFLVYFEKMSREPKFCHPWPPICLIEIESIMNLSSLICSEMEDEIIDLTDETASYLSLATAESIVDLTEDII